MDKAKRLTTEQKAAIQNYWRAIASQDNYSGSVFVSPTQDAYYVRLLTERAAECERLGVPQSINQMSPKGA